MINKSGRDAVRPHNKPFKLLIIIKWQLHSNVDQIDNNNLSIK
jgi:hypothetical protein